MFGGRYQQDKTLACAKATEETALEVETLHTVLCPESPHHSEQRHSKFVVSLRILDTLVGIGLRWHMHAV
jgi:hypothetical protein